MFGNRQQFDMREAHFLHIIDQLYRQFPIIQEVAAAVSLPGAEMYFVNRHGFVQPVMVWPSLHPFAVQPLVAVFFDNDRRGLWAKFKLLSVGSVLTNNSPLWRLMISNLYKQPVVSPGMNISQIPLLPRLRMGGNGRPSG